MTRRQPTFAPGEIFGGYEIVRPMGTGGFGAVYEAIKRPLNKRVALKVLHTEMAAQADVVARFLREAQAAAQIAHPHIVDVIDMGAAGEQVFLAMEYLEGESLAARLKRDGSLGVTDAVDLVVPVCSALEAAHATGVVHRDLKPDNIFLARARSGGTTPKLLDFGVAKVRMNEADTALTRTASLIGTPHYMSPEQARESKSVDPRSDQFSLAIVLYECLAGQLPFPDESLLALLMAITTRSPPSLQAAAPTVPAALEAVVFRALAKEPDDRFPSMRAFGAALLPFASTSVRQAWSAELLGGEAGPATTGTHIAAPSVAAPQPAQAASVMAPKAAFAAPAPTPALTAMSVPATVPAPRAGRRWAILAGSAAVSLGLTVGALFAAGVLPSGGVAVGTVAAPSGLSGQPPPTPAAPEAAPTPTAAPPSDAPVARAAAAVTPPEEAPPPAAPSAAPTDPTGAAEARTARAPDPAPEAERGRREASGARRDRPDEPLVPSERSPAPDGPRGPGDGPSTGPGLAFRTRPTRDELRAAMRAVTPRLLQCGQGTGASVWLMMVFSTTGDPVAVGVSRPIQGTPAEDCVLETLRQVHIAPFTGAAYTYRYRMDMPR